MLTVERKTWLLGFELVQAAEEGRNVEELKERLGSLSKLRIGHSELDKLYGEILSSPTVPGWSYVEPDSLEEIKRDADLPKDEETWISRHELLDRMLGAWFGRVIGNMLGKPVEGWSRDSIEEYLKKAGCYPLEYYIPELIPRVEKSLQTYYVTGGLRGNLSRALRDDDLDYTILGLLLLERKGFNFTTDDVAEEWLNRLPFNLTYTAEREAYRNLTLGLKPPETAIFWNPFREWIGAQIRADPWGYANPKRPWSAAEMAYRDARLSHVKNGIYGEMLIAAMVASAFAESDPLEAIKKGLSCIPRESRLAEAVRHCIDLWRKHGDFDTAYEEAMLKYGRYHPVHTINNAVIVVLSLLYGERDFGKSVCLSVSGGLDTDCNGATVGSIVGAMVGFKGIPEKWYSPLNNTLETALSGLKELKISELADRMVEAVAKNLTGHLR
ncbi:MAG: ADP-ribosylglycohydrolase family protein [Crenarchaeota archaeon]|nr:ADP-ribosylglycohydrolase family protein [Thermoproteota archaeon]